MNILLLTPIYPSDDGDPGQTPVVHYFAREWPKMGHDVRVMYFPYNFPAIINALATPLSALIASKEGTKIRTCKLTERAFLIDGVPVKRVPLNRFRPHSRYGKSQIEKAYNQTVGYCHQTGFAPETVPESPRPPGRRR